MKQKLNIVRVSHYLIVLCLVVYIMIIGDFILQPIFFGLMFMFILKPLCDWLEKFFKSRMLSIFIAFLITLTPVVGLIWVLSAQAVSIFRNLPSLGQRLQTSISDLINWIGTKAPIQTTDITSALQENISSITNTAITIITSGVNSSTTIIAGTIFALLYTFFFLYYRKSFKEFIIVQASKSMQAKTRETLSEIQAVIMKYCYGMLMVIGILAVLNTTGLYFLGIKYPIFWGVLAAFLAIIPYIGTTLGGLLPFIYAIATTTTIWQPVGVVILYASIQQIEGNLITPNVVGSSIRINPLFAIISLILGGAIWGLAGLILALPAMAIIKLLFEKIDPFKTLAAIMSSDIGDNYERLNTELNENRFRLSSLFKTDRYTTRHDVEEEGEEDG